MYEAAEKLEFEKAASLRDRIEAIRNPLAETPAADRSPKKTGRHGRQVR